MASVPLPEAARLVPPVAGFVQASHAETSGESPLAASWRTANNPEEVEALAFGIQLLPDSKARQHDQGADAVPGLDFGGAPVAGMPGLGVAETAIGTPAGRAYGLEMIDPDEFDLYDSPSESAAITADDPNSSVDIRLDLARLYIEMDDVAAARELLADISERGDERQRREAAALLDRL